MRFYGTVICGGNRIGQAFALIFSRTALIVLWFGSKKE